MGENSTSKRPRRRKMSTSPARRTADENDNGLSRQKSRRKSSRSSSESFVVKPRRMSDNLRTALFYLFALMTTWLIFCFLTFSYFTSTEKKLDDRLGRLMRATAGDRSIGDSKTDRGRSIVDEMMDRERAEHLTIEQPVKSKSDIEYDQDLGDDGLKVKIPEDPEIDRLAPDDQSVDGRPPIDWPCYGICPESPSNQLDHVVIQIQNRLRQKLTSPFIDHFPAKSKIQISKPELPKYANLDTLKIHKLSLPGGGAQIRLILHTDHGRYIFKPETNNDSTIRLSPKRDACRIAGLYSSELAAYYLSLLMPFVKVPTSVGARLNLSGLWEKRDRLFQEHSWIQPEDEARLCFKGTCRFCRKPICVYPDEQLVGAISPWIPSSTYSKFDNPWFESCDKRGMEKWRTGADFCRSSTSKMEYPFFAQENNTRTGLLRLIDVAIFDYLIDYPDRNILYFEPNSNVRGFVLFENRKAFVDANHGDASILAPLFQCCRIDRRTYEILKRSEATTRMKVGHNDDEILSADVEHSKFSAEFRKVMAVDPLSPLLDQEHLDAVERRLHKVIALVELCVERYGEENVIT